MLLREVQRAALMEDILHKLVGHMNVEGMSDDAYISKRIRISLVREAQSLLNEPHCAGRYGKAAKGA